MCSKHDLEQIILILEKKDNALRLLATNFSYILIRNEKSGLKNIG